MPKFTFVCEHLDEESTHVERRNTVEFTAETWHDVLQEVQDFLRGCGYYFDGDVTVVDDGSNGFCVKSDFDDETTSFNIDTGTGIDSSTITINTDGMFNTSVSDTITFTTGGHSSHWHDTDRNR